MSQDLFELRGRLTPYREDQESSLFAVFSADGDEMAVRLYRNGEVSARLSFQAWEHTVHELESLSAALSRTSRGPLPLVDEIGAPNSLIGGTVKLFSSVDLELGYSLLNPGSERVRVFVSSRPTGRGREQKVWFAAAIGGCFVEAVFEPDRAIEFAEWIDRQICTLTSEDVP